MTAIAQWWTSLSPHHPQIIAFALTTGGAVIAHFLRARVKLIYGRANNSYHVLKPEQNVIHVYCEKIYIQNVGRKPAENVEIILACAPTEITLFPARNYDKKVSPEERLIISLPFISPGELVIIDTIHVNNRTAEVLSVRCPENIGKSVEFWVLRKATKFNMAFWMTAALLGIFYCLQTLVALVSNFGGNP